jgi:hypothetical protein
VIHVIGYGSLTSARGLGRSLAGVEGCWPVRVEARRRFGKPPQGRCYLAMDLHDLPAAVLRAERIDLRSPSGHTAGGAAFHGLLLAVGPDEAVQLARREGYPPRCWERVCAAAGPRGPAAFLLDLAHAVGDDVLDYRRALREVAGPTPLDAYHYLPHPVDTDREPALIYVPPEPGRTGDAAVDSRKAILPGEVVLGVLDTLFEVGGLAFGAAFDAARQQHYVELCLLGAAHGLDVSDLLGQLSPTDPTTELLARWRSDLDQLREEQRGLREVAGPDYARWFEPDLDAALRRSGLL